MRRMLLLLMVVALVLVMLVASAAPAFAQGASPFGHCEKFVHQHSGFQGPGPCIPPGRF